MSSRSRDGASTCAQCEYHVLLKGYVLAKKEKKIINPLLLHTPYLSHASLVHNKNNIGDKIEY